MELEIVNKLYLELSQVATAQTQNEIKLRDELLVANARISQLQSAILWALGQEGGFNPQPPGAGKYWWRSELRQRAAAMPNESKLSHGGGES